jgi:multidrug efflux pump subunit AcrA (membrane-fusion protein)
MLTKYVLPCVAVAGVFLAVLYVRASNQPTQPSQPLSPPAQAPFDAYLAGAGLVEASTENIAVGTVVAGVVQEVHVKVGADVTRGDALFTIDDRDLQAELLVRRAALRAAEERLAKLQAMPRAEDVPPAEARVAAAAADLEEARTLYEMWNNIADPRAVSAEELKTRKSNYDAANARLAQAQAELALLKAGAWTADLEIAQAELLAAAAQAKSVETNIDRLTVRAPVDGRVLQVKVRRGEFAPTGVLATPLMLLGDVGRLHVRVDIDENDAWRLRENARARAFLKGNRELATDLSFVAVEPYVVPKRSLTGESTERVDTRVLQVIYSFDRASLPVYVGQQMDVFIESAR